MEVSFGALLDHALMFMMAIFFILGASVTFCIGYVHLRKIIHRKTKANILRQLDQVYKFIQDNGGFHDSFGSYAKTQTGRKEIIQRQKQFEELMDQLNSFIKENM